MFDSRELRGILTDTQRNEIAAVIGAAFTDINTNQYDVTRNSADLLAFYTNDKNAATNQLTKDAISVKTATDLDTVADLALATAVMQALESINPNDQTLTGLRLEQWVNDTRQRILEQNPDLNAQQQQRLAEYAWDYLDANPRRLTNAQVQQLNQQASSQAGTPTVQSATSATTGQPTQTQSLLGANVTAPAGTTNPQGAGISPLQHATATTNLLNPTTQTGHTLS